MDGRKKIIFVITKSNWGGAQRYVYNLATNLPQKKFDVSVVLGGGGVLKERLEEHHITTISLNKLEREIHILSEFAVFFKLIRIFWSKKPDIVHLNSSKIGGLGSLAGRVTGVKRIIFTVHGWAFNESRNLFARIIIRILSWMTVMFSHHIITVSKKDYAQTQKMPFAKKTRLSLIYNGIQTHQLYSKKDARSMLMGDVYNTIPRNTLWIGSVGELTQNKGFSYALEALRIFKEIANIPFIYIIMGDGEDKYRLYNQIKIKGLEKNVHLVGFQKDAAAVLRAFDIFLLPSIKEGIPYTLLEAGLAKLPVIATDVGGIPEVITDMQSGILIRSKNPREIQRAFEFIVRHPKKRTLYGNNLNAQIRKEFTFHAFIQKTLSVYENSLY